jgi:hypothetical protein
MLGLLERYRGKARDTGNPCPKHVSIESNEDIVDRECWQGQIQPLWPHLGFSFPESQAHLREGIGQAAADEVQTNKVKSPERLPCVCVCLRRIRVFVCLLCFWQLKRPGFVTAAQPFQSVRKYGSSGPQR